MITQLVFYVFSTIMILSAVMVVSTRNPVHSVLYLVVTFFNAAGLFLVAGAEFLAFLLIIVYVGAVAVLFLFVVMMLDINFSRLKEGFQRYAPIGAVIGAVLLVEMVLAVGQWKLSPSLVNQNVNSSSMIDTKVTNTAALGELVYTHYIFLFQACAIILLVAMIGAIVLTLREKPLAKRQNINLQHDRKPSQTLSMVTTKLGKGVKENGGFYRPSNSYYSVEAPGSFGLEEALQAEQKSSWKQEKQQERVE